MRTDPDLAEGGVREHVRELGVGQSPGAELFDLGVQVGANAGGFRLGGASVDPEGADRVVHGPGGDAVHVVLHDHRVQGPIDPPATLEQRRDERPCSQFRDLCLDVSGRGRDRLRAVTVAVGRAALGALIVVSVVLRRGFGLDQRLHAGPHQRGEHRLWIGGQQCIELGVYARVGMGQRVVCLLL